MQSVTYLADILKLIKLKHLGVQTLQYACSNGGITSCGLGSEGVAATLAMPAMASNLLV